MNVYKIQRISGFKYVDIEFYIIVVENQNQVKDLLFKIKMLDLEDLENNFKIILIDHKTYSEPTIIAEVFD